MVVEERKLLCAYVHTYSTYVQEHMYLCLTQHKPNSDSFTDNTEHQLCSFPKFFIGTCMYASGSGRHTQPKSIGKYTSGFV